MTKKQQTQHQHGAIEKVCHLHNFLSPSSVSHFVNLTLSHPLCYSQKISDFGMSEQKIFGI